MRDVPVETSSLHFVLNLVITMWDPRERDLSKYHLDLNIPVNRLSKKAYSWKEDLAEDFLLTPIPAK